MKKPTLKPTLLALSLGMLVAAATMPAHAEDQPLDQRAHLDEQRTSEQAEKKTTNEKPTDLKMKSVMLPADVEGGRRGVDRPLMLTSSVLLATGYVPALITALANSKQTSGWLGVPVVGPWIDWGPNTSTGNKFLLFGSGLLQAAGLAGIVTSFFVPESKTKKMPMMGKRIFKVAPVAGRGTYMLSATGVF